MAGCHTISDVVAQQQFQRRPSRLLNFIRFSFDFHSLSRYGCAGGDKPVVDFYYTRQAGRRGLISLSEAKGWYVNSQLAKREAKEAGFDEAVLLDTDGFVAEGPGENIFIVRKGVLKTTPMSSSILEGITRETILQLAEERNIQIREERFTRDDLYLADEAFFTGTAAEVTPIREVDGRMIGSGAPGPITKQLQKSFFDIVRGKARIHRNWLTQV